MKNLVQYINEHQEFIAEYCDMLDQINLEIITESFGCKLLKDLVDQQCKMLDEWKDRSAAIAYSSYTKPFDINYIFKNSHIFWDKITDDEVQTFKGADTEGLKLFKRICSNRSNSLYGMIVIETVESEHSKYKYSGVIVKESTYIRYYALAMDSHNKELKPNEATTLLNSNTVYHIIILDDVKSRDKLRAERSNSQYGVVKQGDVEYLKRLADQNRDRYKKLAAKLRVERQAENDKLPQQVDEVVDKVMKLSIEFAKNPVKYAKFEYEIKKLFELVSDKEVGYYERGKYHKYGINGLMYYFSSYMHTKLAIAKGSSYDFEQKEFEVAKKKLIEMIDKINKSYDEIIQKASETN